MVTVLPVLPPMLRSPPPETAGIVSDNVTAKDLCKDLRDDAVHDGLGIGGADANVLILGQRP